MCHYHSFLLLISLYSSNTSCQYLLITRLPSSSNHVLIHLVVRVSVEIITWNRILTYFFNPASLVVFDVPSLYWIVRVYMWPYRGRVEWSFHTSSALYRVIAIVTIYCDTQYTWWIKWLLHIIKYREIATDLILMSKSEFSQIKTSIPTTITRLFNCVLMTTLFT